MTKTYSFFTNQWLYKSGYDTQQRGQPLPPNLDVNKIITEFNCNKTLRFWSILGSDVPLKTFLNHSHKTRHNGNHQLTSNVP